MRTIDDIAITAETILSLEIEGLPTSDRALRRHAQKHGWPILYDSGKKTYFLVDAIPEPFGSAIREALNRPCPRVPAPSVGPALLSKAVHPRSAAGIMEARLAILFEVFRRAAYMAEAKAIRSVVQAARSKSLPQYLMAAAEAAVIGGGRSSARWSGEQGSIPLIGQDHNVFLTPDEESERQRRSADKGGTLRETKNEYTILSYTTLRKWIVSFNRHGSCGLFPGSVIK